MKYIRKPGSVEAITFHQLIEFGKKEVKNLVNGMPWSFEYKGFPISHEKDDVYLVIASRRVLFMTPTDLLCIDEEGRAEVYNSGHFQQTHILIQQEKNSLEKKIEEIKTYIEKKLVPRSFVSYGGVFHEQATFRPCDVKELLNSIVKDLTAINSQQKREEESYE